MKLEETTAKTIISLFHDNANVDIYVKDIRDEEDDIRFIIYIDDSNDKFVMKAAYNNFTYPERINGWVQLIQQYKEMGYYSPELCRSKNGHYEEQMVIQDKEFCIWEEQFAKYPLVSRQDKVYSSDEKRLYRYEEGVIEFFARVGQKHLKSNWGNGGNIRLVPFGTSDKTDEIMECVETFTSIVKEKAPNHINQYNRVLQLFQQNLETLKKVYKTLPTSVFQGDWGDNNILVDDHHNFKGVIDFNLSGLDTVLNMAITMGIYSLGKHKIDLDSSKDIPYLSPKYREYIIEHMLYIIKRFSRFYHFAEDEIKAAPLLYKYIITFSYETITYLEDHVKDDDKTDMLFQNMEQELLRNDIDFRSAMK